MGARVALLSALVLIVHACGGEEFSDDAKNSGGTGGATGGTGGGSGGSVGGTGGSAAGSGGVAGTGGATGGAGGAGGSAGADGSAGDATVDGSTDAASDAGPPPIVVVQASPLKLSMPGELTSTITFATAPNAGNSIIVGITCVSDHGVIMNDAGTGATQNGDCLVPTGSVTDNHGNSYAQVVQGSPIKSSHQAARGYIFIAETITVPSSPFAIKVDPVGTSNVQAIAWGVIEVSGLSAPPSLDASGYTAAASGTTTNASTFQVTTQANELAVAVLSVRHDQTYAGIQPSAGWSPHQIHQDNANGPPAHSMVSKVLNSTGTASHTWTHAVPSRGAAGVIATFKGAATN